jgi:hypothetical protein
MLMIILLSPPSSPAAPAHAATLSTAWSNGSFAENVRGIDSHPDGVIAKPNAHSSQIGPDGNGGGTPPPGGSPLHAVGGGKCLDDPNSSTSEQAGQLCPGRAGNIAGERTVPCRLGIPRRLREDFGEGPGS